MLRDGQGKRETGRYKLFARLRNKELKMEPRFWPSVGSGSSNRRKEKVMGRGGSKKKVSFDGVK